nr:MAG TPA: tail protein [Caudoviricetes sp.]
MVLESNTLDVLFVKDGQQGEDGKVLYTWIKYAKAANGTGMTDDPDGAIYIGISYNNESSIESNDPTQYAWTKIQGADGKKGEDAYTIFLENENISFATDKNRNPLSEQAYTSGITIMKGAKPVTGFTIGDIAKTQGIAVAKTDTAIAISVVNGNPLPNDSGEIEIPITVGGTVFKKILTWTCAKKGDQGERGLQGIQGPQGEQGIAGKDGTSVTIINKSITYQLSTSGTVIPTGTWQTSPQTIPEGQYQWTKTSVTYSDGNQTESYSISYHGKNGSDGTSVKTTSTSVKYQVGDSGTTKPTGTWQSNVPTVAQGKYLWTQTIVNYSDGNSTESYSVSYRGIDGSNGVNGMNAATIYLYQRATSTPSKPSNTLTYTFSTTKITGTLNNGWSTAIPTGTDAVYVTVASVSSKNDTATITTSAWSTPVVLAQNGKTGSDGKAGLNVATIYLYQRNTSKPSKPSASVTYTFSTGVASGLNNGWSQKIPDGTNPLYVTLATASSNTATDTILSSEWSDVVVMAQNGEDGISPKVSLSKTGGTTTISIVDATGTHTQSVKDGTNGTPGTDGKDGKTSYFHVKYSNDGGKTFTGNSGEDTGIYMGSYTDYTEADSTDVKKYNWVKVKGDKGDTGQKGQDGTSVKITSKSVTYQTSTSGTTAPTGTWVTTVPTVNNGQYLWTKTTVQYSDGNKTEAYSVSYKGTNGTNGTSVTVSKTEVTYQVSTSGTTAPTGTWSTTMPSCDQGQYLWTKTYVKYSDGKDTTSYSVSYKGVDGEKFAFNMLRETNQGSKHWVNMGASGKYSVESITTEDSINAVKLICTEPIASNEWQFCDFSDYEMLKSLKASTTYTLSYDIKTNRSGKILHNIKTGGGQKVFFANDIACKVLGNETWEHVSLKMTSGTTLPNLDGQVIYMFGDALSKVGYSIIKNLKLTEGIIDTPWAPHPEDLEGRGVSETVQYYLATSQASGVTSSTSGWSTDITTQKLTADKKYLWNCYQTKYSDGTSEPISTPKVIGVYGDKGQNAKNLTITPSSQYFKSTDGGKTFTPDTITIKPTIQGEINFGKWQYSIDGGVSFADVMSGQKGLMISNNVLTVSKDSSLYSDAVTMVTFRAVASDSSFYDTCSIAKIYDVSDIGDGRNLLWNSNFAKTDEAITGTTNSWGLHTRGTNLVASIDTSTKHNGFNTLKTVSAANGDKNSSNDLEWFAWGISERTSDNLHSKNQNYTLSFYAKASVTTDFIVRWGYDAYGADTTRTLTTNWQKYEIKLHQATSAYSITIIFKLLTAGTVWFSEFKLEKGSSATGYSTAPEDLQTAILSTKSEISDVSLKVDNNKQAIEQRVEKTTYQQDLKLVKGDISKANEGLNKWRYEIYPKSLFTSEYQGKSTMDVFAKNTNLTPSQSVLINDTDFGKNWAYGDNYIGYALTFVKFSATKSVAITFKHDDGAHLYLNGKLIGGDDTCNTGSGESLTLSFIQGWNCLEVVLNEKSGGEYIGLGTTISAISECQLMNCYYGTPVARQSHITNQLVQNTTDIDGVSGSVQKVMSTVGGSGKIDEFVSNYATWKKKVDGIETRVGETYTTKDDFDDLQIGGRNLLKHSSMIGEKLICDNYFICNNCNIQEYTNDGFHIITPTEGNANNGIAFAFDNFTIMEINGGDTITFSCDIKGTSDSHAPFVSIHISDNNWYGSGVVQKNTNVSITKDWQRVSVTITTPTGLTKNHMWLAIHGNHQSDLYVRNFKLEKGNKPTDWTPAPEDVNGKIVNVETIANQTADKFSWIVKSGTSSSNFEITDRLMNLVSANINLDGIVSFMNTAKGDGRKNLYNLDYSSFENVASQEDAICYAKDNGVTSVGIDSSVSYDGDKSLKISYTTANLNSSTTPLYLGSSANNYGCVKIQAGKQYILSCYVKSDSTTGLFMIDIQGHDTPDTKTDGLYLSNIDPRKLPGSSTGVNLSTDWQRAVCAIKVADNATGLYWSVVPLIWGRPSSSSVPQTFNVWVDCIMLEEVDSISNEPGTYIFDKETIIDGGSIKTDTITGNQILAGSITADKIATDAIKSHNYISSGGTQGSFLNLGDGSFTSPNLSWDSNGNLIAKNANLSGKITATNGSIAGWTIISNKMYTTGSGKYTGIGKYGSAYAFWAGATSNDNGNSAVFKVGHTGKLTATDADITGTITATNGKIGRYDITSTYLMTNSGSNASGIGGNQAFWAGAEDSNSAPFRVGYDGVLWAENAAIRGSIETGNLGDEGDTVSIINGHIGIQGTSNNVEIYSTGFKFGIDGDYYLESVSEGVKCYRNLYATDFIADGWIYNASGGHYTWKDRNDAYISCGDYNGHNVYYYANYHAFYVNKDSGQGMMYINTNGVTSRVGFTKTSDERIKKNFESFDDNIIDAYMNIEPVKYQLKQSSNDKYHFGFKAQHIDKVFSDYGDTYNESFDICTSRPIDPDKAKELYGVDGMVEEYGLRYDELIAPTTYMVQHIYKELEQVKQEKADLETRLQAIEAKLRL